MPAAPCTCSVVLSVSMGEITMRKSAAAHEARKVFTAAGRFVFSRSATAPALEAVSPKRESGPCMRAKETPW